MSNGIQVRKGAMLMWRLGNLEFGTQERWSRAPESRGMWAFPWPYMEPFLTYHKYRDLYPKRFARTANRGWPADAQWYEKNDQPVDFVEFDEDGVPVDKELSVRGEYYDEADKWFRSTGKRILPVRKFWYEGEVYSHIDKKGKVGNSATMGGTLEDTDWFRMHTSELAVAIQKARGDRVPGRYGDKFSLHRASHDHLEIFIPPKAGKISSPKDWREGK